MSESISILVTLDREYDEEEMEKVLETLKMLKFVLHAEKAPEPRMLERYSLKRQIQRELIDKLWKALE